LKFLLCDKWGDLSVAYIHDATKPVLVDFEGRPIIDLESNPFYPQPYQRPSKNDHPAKQTLDAFMMPSCGFGILEHWLNYPENVEMWDRMFHIYETVLYVLTGKTLLDVSK
jgi:hypothetical protein